MSRDVFVILDDTSPAFKYGGNIAWSEVNDIPFYNSTIIFAQPSPGKTGTITATFNGTRITFFGNSPPLTSSQNLLVTIDGNAAYNTSYFPDRQTNQSTGQLFTSPDLRDGPHTVILDALDGIALDYAVVKIGQSNVLNNKTTIIVDNDDPSITYSGSGWTKNSQKFGPFEGQPGGTPFQNSTRQTSNVGDTVTINFTGPSIALYGTKSFTEEGSLEATYTIDNSPVPLRQDYDIPINAPELKNGGGVQHNAPLFGALNLNNTVHTLVVNITFAEHLFYSLDYVTYAPSFDSLATIPDLTNVYNPNPSLDPSSSTASSTSSHSTCFCSSQTSGNTGTAISAATNNSHKLSSGGIAGVVIGVLAGVLLLLAVAFMFWRRNRSKPRSERPNFLDESGYNHSVPDTRMAVNYATPPEYH